MKKPEIQMPRQHKDNFYIIPIFQKMKIISH